MKWTSLFASLVLGLAVCTPGYSFELLDMMLGSSGCGCESSCQPSCQPTCCVKYKKCRCHHNRCCKPSCCAPSCGDAAPTCGAAAPTCAAPAPTCAAAAPLFCTMFQSSTPVARVRAFESSRRYRPSSDASAGDVSVSFCRCVRGHSRMWPLERGIMSRKATRKVVLRTTKDEGLVLVGLMEDDSGDGGSVGGKVG